MAEEFPGHPPGEDTVEGGRGDDQIFAADGAKDAIDCGPGTDEVYYDVPGVDTIVNCETKHPV